jgi:hypothetical protein
MISTTTSATSTTTETTAASASTITATTSITCCESYLLLPKTEVAKFWICSSLLAKICSSECDALSN